MSPFSFVALTKTLPAKASGMLLLFSINGFSIFIGSPIIIPGAVLYTPATNLS